MRIARLLFLAMAAWLLGMFAPCAALAQEGPRTIYVSPVGSDKNDGLAVTRPLRSLAAAMERAKPGSTVELASGRYTEQLVTRYGGTREAPIIITSKAGAAVIDGSTMSWPRAADQNRALVELRHPFVRLIAITVANSRNTGILLDADDLTVERCRVADSQLHGISTDTSRQKRANQPMIQRVALLDNVVTRAALAGRSQAISLIADGFMVSGNTVRHSPKEGIDIWLGSRRGEVVGNTVYGNGAAGIYIDGATSVKVHRNTIYGNRAGVGVSSEDVRYATNTVAVFNNVVFDNRDSAFFVWDDPSRPGRQGVQNVLIAYNTSARNRYPLYLAGRGNSVWFLNNLIFQNRGAIQNQADSTHLVSEGNVWASGADAVVAVAHNDFRPSAQSPAIDRGRLSWPLIETGSEFFAIPKDYGGNPRIVGTAPDAGAFEYQGETPAR